MGKGKSSKSETKIDPRLTDASLDALDYAMVAARMPNLPNRGVRIAAFTPAQEAGFSGTNAMARSMGLTTAPVGAGMPAVETAGNGVRGYSTGTVYDANKAASMGPGMISAMDALFADPKTGKLPTATSALFQQIYGTKSGKGSTKTPTTTPAPAKPTGKAPGKYGDSRDEEDRD